MTTNDSKSYLNYLNKLADEYNHTYHLSIGKKPFYDNSSSLCKEIKINPWAPN